MRQIIGVMPSEFHFPADNTLLWVNNPVRPDQVQPGQGGGPMIGRMKPGVTREQLSTGLTRLSKQVPERFGGPPNSRAPSVSTALVDPLLDRMVGPDQPVAVGPAGAVATVLLIARPTYNLAGASRGRHRDLPCAAIGPSRTSSSGCRWPRQCWWRWWRRTRRVLAADAADVPARRAEGIPRLGLVGPANAGRRIRPGAGRRMACGTVPARLLARPQSLA
jgi:hypothetical protein